jgi:DNA-binding NtrC family response regulator
MCSVKAKILTVGVAGADEALKELPVQLLVMETGLQAIRCLRDEKIDTMISHWNLVDFPQGALLENVIPAKPSMPTIAFIHSGDIYQEIAARSLGVTAVLNEDIDPQSFRQVVCQLLRIPSAQTMLISDNVNECNNNIPEVAAGVFN